MGDTFVSQAVRVVSYPGIMVGGLVLLVLLERAGVPLTLSSYLPVAAAAGLITLHEIALPHRAAWKPGRTEIANDATFLVAVQILVPFLLSLIAALWLANRAQSSGWTLTTLWPRDLPVVIQALLMLLGADFLRYWMHRAFHRFTPLWRLHAVHHSPHRLYWLNVGRFHPLEKAIQFLADALPFILLGVSEPVLAVYFVFFAINGFFQHSNCSVRLGPLNYVVSGPELHRWHHSQLPTESDTNFGNNLIVWDLIFGTRFLPADRKVETLGLQNRGYPQQFLAQMKSPFSVDPGAG
ncbi:MAG: sterol desaturase family protein [Alphaproteobacteria bacterium]|nr:sterol desaturase family protein [Alphaproteobacteria bacterium]